MYLNSNNNNNNDKETTSSSPPPHHPLSNYTVSNLPHCCGCRHAGGDTQPRFQCTLTILVLYYDMCIQDTRVVYIFVSFEWISRAGTPTFVQLCKHHCCCRCRCYDLMKRAWTTRNGNGSARPCMGTTQKKKKKKKHTRTSTSTSATVTTGSKQHNNNARQHAR